MTVRGGILQFVGESLPRSWSHKRLYSVLPCLHEDRPVTRPSVEDLPFPLQRARFPSGGSARSRHVFIDEQVCSLQLPGVTHNCRLRVMRGEADDDIARCRSVLRLLSHAMGAHQVAGVNLHVEFTGSKVLDEPVSVFCSRLRQTGDGDRRN